MANRRGTPTACTVVARNYLPAARVLAASYLRHHPGHEFVIAVIDAEPGATRSANGHRVVGPEAFGIDRDTYLRMATAYSVTELATAVKPFLLRQLRAQSDVVIYLDPDITVYAPMPELVELATAHGIVLTPHFLAPLPRDGKEPTEAAIMGAGIFNLGFVATGPGAEPFLDFWAQRLRQDAIVAPDKQLFTDQRWVDQVPALFGHHVLRDPGFNVAYWNAHERDLHADPGGTVTAAGKPLRFFHFSGYRPEKPWLLTNHTPRRPRVMLSAYPQIRALCDDYGKALKSAGYAETLDAVPYGFAELDDGTKLTTAMRRLFRAAWVRAERKGKPLPPAGFGPGGGQALRDWLAGPAEHIPAGSGLNRITMAVWDSRPDLQAAFPQPYGAHAATFRAWCRSSGRIEEKLADWALPAEPAELTEPVDELGVNVLGYLTAELGVGEMGRIVLDAITQADVPVAAVVEDRLVSNRTGLADPQTLGTPKFPVSLLCVNADQTAPVLDAHPQVGHHRYRIGLWAWEVAEFPEELHTAFGLVDEVWTISEFCREAIAAHTTVPVKTIPVPVRDPGMPQRKGRADGEPVRFLFAFDFYSIPDRKNPWGLVRTFQQAFAGRDDVRLTIKAINGNKHPDRAEQLRVLVGDDPRIELIERYLSVAELHELYDTSDCYVSLHRSEGFGLTVAEAMIRGLPVISTDYSGTAEFLDERTGWPIPYELVPVGPKQGPYPADAVWADPDIEAAAQAMQAVADDPDEAARRGRMAREHILRTRSFPLAAQWMRTQLKAAHEAWRAGRAKAGADRGADPMTALRDARQALLWRAEVSSASRVPLAPALRKAVLRAIDHYDVHQRKVMGALTDGVEGTTAALAARIEALEQRLARSAELTDKLQELDRAAPAVAQSLLELRQDVLELREADNTATEAVDQVRGRVDGLERKTHDMFTERDRRSDDDQARIAAVTRDLAAVQQAARLRHAPVPDGADVVVCDAGALLAPDDDVVMPWLRYHRSWERSEADLMASLAGSGTFVDVGAHVGYHTLRLLQSATGVGRVVAVEANPTNADYLRRNVSANLGPAGADTVTVLPVAAWDSRGEIRLVQAEAGNSGDHRANPVDGGTGGVVVPAVRLDQVPEIVEHPVSLVKVDLQGRDHRALAGLTDVLDRDHPHVVCEFCPEAIEELGDDPGEVLAGYRKLGYRPVLVTDEGPVEGEHTELELITAARTAESGFVTVWLQPARTADSAH